MKTLLALGILISAWFCNGQSVAETNRLPSDTAIRQMMAGTWFLDYARVFQSTITISSNGDYVAYRTSGKTRTNKLEGTLEVRDGLMIDTLKKSSLTNEPVPLVFTNVFVRVNDRELVFRAQNRSQEMVFRKVTK